MSESDGEQAARSVALEQAYVHDVYEQCAEKTAQSRHWPRIHQFLEELEPGALVCDVGCGNGKYLSVNQSIFKVGADRCKRLTNIAREKENEVLICDNLALPFRDESFDAVLSIAVVHHFATTERRVRALKELARVLRIGGRLVISVWAMEQRHRKFESQDVLVPWPKVYCCNSSANGTRPSAIPYENEIQQDQVTKRDLLTSNKASQQKYRSKSYWIDPIFSPSPSTSSLSSPNETCYSFFRRALQKLAGKRGLGLGHRPWFFETWHNGTGKERRHVEHDDSADVDDLPIELRRLEDINVTINKFPDNLSVKSKSLGDILEIQRLDLVRSRSSIPGLCSTLTSDSFLDEHSEAPSRSNSKPKLVKQKSHFFDDNCLEISENTAIQELIKDLPDFQITSNLPTNRTNVYKQSSMNEELMSMERLREKELIRQNITKQTSLNEEIICKRKAFETLKDSFYSVNATKRFQLLKSGLTNKIKQSTTNIEKVSGMSIKNGFVRMLQGWKSGESQVADASNVNCAFVSPKGKTTDKTFSTVIKRDVDCIERRLSREDGSDSSKDSSLQSDTSVDSEDSFASVIYVPKQDMPPLIDVISTTPGYQLSAMSAPPSPRIKHPPDLMGQRLKLIPMSPLLKQFPATSKSLPPPSPPGLSPRTFNSVPNKPFFSSFFNNQQTSVFDKSIGKNELEDGVSKSNNQDIDLRNLQPDGPKITEHKSSLQITSANDDKYSITKAINRNRTLSIDDNVMGKPVFEDTLKSAQEKLIEKSIVESSLSEDDNRKMRLNQIKELLKQRPGFATRCSKSSFPLVRRASTATSGRLETVARPLPHLLSLELFNPETDDLDSDSSGVSSPESVGSVISVISDERFVNEKGNTRSNESEANAVDCASNEMICSNVNGSDLTHPDSIPYDLLASASSNGSSVQVSTTSSQSLRLIEAAANVASSLEDAVETVIQLKTRGTPCSTQAQRRTSIAGDMSSTRNSWRTSASPTELQELLSGSKQTSGCVSSDKKSWNEECRQHLIDFTEKLSENLIHDIDQYCQKTELEFTKDLNNKRRGSFKSKQESNITSTRIVPPVSPLYSEISSSGAIESCKYSEFVDTIAWLNDSTGGNDNSENDNKPSDSLLGLECSNAGLSSQNLINNVLMYRSIPEDVMDFVLISNNGEIVNEEENTAEGKSEGSCSTETISHSNDTSQNDVTTADASKKSYLRFGNSMESSDIGDSVENTISDSSQMESFPAENLCNENVTSLGSNRAKYKNASGKQKFIKQMRSASEEIPSRTSVAKQQVSINSECLVTPMTNGTVSGSSSQESLPSDHGGGAITYHQYYHVFREGELDQLINKYVENLHIISSYYDHANWCIVAEKVQVWTI